MEEPRLELFERYCAGTASSEETKFVEDWLRENAIDPRDLRILLEAPPGLRFMLSINKADEWSRLKPQTQRSRVITLAWRVAASVALVALVAYLVVKFKYASDDYVIVQNTGTHVEKLVLPDSSVVYLNKGALVKYPRDFDRERALLMKGEAYFEVQHDPSRPFSVSAGKWRATVLGTSFNILGDSIGIALTVTTGKVALRAQASEIILMAGDKGVYADSIGVCTKEQNRELNFLAWKTGELTFDNTPMSIVVRDIEKYFDVKIEVDAATLGQLPNYTSRFRDPSLVEVLDEINALLLVDYSIRGKNVIITQRQ